MEPCKNTELSNLPMSKIERRIQTLSAAIQAIDGVDTSFVSSLLWKYLERYTNLCCIECEVDFSDPPDDCKEDIERID